MKKIYSLLLLGGLLLFGAQSAWADFHVYFAIPSDKVPTGCVVQFLVNNDANTWNDGWQTMTKTSKTFGGKDVYEGSYTSTATKLWDAYFRVYETSTSTQKEYNETIKGSETSLANFNNRLFAYNDGTKYDTYTLLGSWDTWTSAELLLDGGVTKSFNQVTDYTFKVQRNGTDWIGLKSGTSYMTPASHENWVLYLESAGGSNNCGVSTSVAGDYNFSWDGATGKISVSYPDEYSRTVTNAGSYGTICLPVGITGVTNAKIYSISSMNSTGDGVILAEQATGTAGYPYIFKLDAGETTVTFALGNTYQSEAQTVGGLVGTYADNTVVAANNYIIYQNQIRKAASSVTIDAFRAYIVKGSIDEYKTSAPGIRTIEILLAPENATDIKSVEENETAVKFIQNGKLFIQKNDVVYDVTGRVVK